MTRSSRWQSALLAVATLSVLVVLAELLLRVLAPVSAGVTPPHINALNPYIRFEYPRNYSALTETEPGLPGLSGVHEFHTNNMGFRGDSLAVPKPAGEFRIFLVGGSTTECFYVDDNDEIGRVVEREIARHVRAGTVPRVYNAGLSGSASDDHIAMISQRIIHLQPDLIVVFCGINDLTRSIYGYDYLHFTAPGPYRRQWYKRWVKDSQLGRRLVFAKQRVKPDPERLQQLRPLKSNYAALVGLERTGTETSEAPRVDDRGYADNLRSMVGIARGNGSALVFMTQPTTWNSTIDPAARERHWMRYRNGIVYREDVMDAAMEALNDVMRSVCEAQGVPLYDFARVLPKSLEYFYDDCHLNTAGATAAGTGLATFLRERALVPASAP